MAYSFLPDEPSSAAAWSVFEARRLLSGAVERLEQNGQELIRLAEDTHWHSKGIAALNRSLSARSHDLAYIAMRVGVAAEELPVL
ncbi:hypothetical protein GCM10025768_03070 [Microbacterium pseudoresistens]|uniref:Uncharacterized protein n=1 Tax=Microbacterium pseudoresistens TaxID=640634 RepID=A0A7Y9JN31_9MICO|nr:hypothetical protein [Microbacterium pseudoresistens]NYD54143.1 hypothetical protein [Microbacterium pseudoresistens]